MNNQFHVRVLGFSILQEIEGARTADDYATLLHAMEFDSTAGMNEDELREMCLMSLQDLKPVAAAAIVLKHDLGDQLNDGQIRNIAGEMLDEKFWEHYADMSFHERMFHVGALLYAAFPQSFPEPDAVQVALEVTAANDAANETLNQALSESLLVRLLADGMSDGSVLHRLFDQQLQGKSFPEAEAIVWIVQTERVSPRALKINVISSGYWLDSLRETQSYDSTAYADETRVG